MPIALVSGPANAGKARFLLDAFGAHLARGEDPLLVVPTRADVVHYRRELAARGVMLGGRVERFSGLAEELARRAGLDGAPALAPLARERILAAVARPRPVRSRSHAPGPFEGVRETPGFQRALSRLFAELESRHVSPSRLRALLGPASEGLEVCALYEAYRRTLERLGRLDRELRTTTALDRLRREPARWGSRPVLFYGFDDMTALELDTIETLGRVVQAPVTVSLAYEAGRAAFAGRARALQRLLPLAEEHRTLPSSPAYYGPRAAALHHLERSLFEPNCGPSPPLWAQEGGGAIRLLEGGGERAELELVAGEIRALLEEGMLPEEIALVHRSPGPVAGLIGEVLRAFDIPHSLERRLPFEQSALGRALIGALRVAVAGEREPPHALLAWLRCPGLLEHPELADQLEARVRQRGLATAAQARAVWEAEHWPLDAIERLAEAARAGTIPLIERLERELEHLFAAPRRRAAAVLGQEELGDAAALAAGRRALAELRELARAERSLVDGPGELLAALEGLELRVGEPPVPGLVAVLDPLALRARRVRALFLCGLQEGVFPAGPRPEALLEEEERGRLAQASGLVLGEGGDRLPEERYLFYATVSRPSELLVVSWHAARDDGSPAAPSPFLEDLCELFQDDLRTARRRRALGAAGWPGPGPASERWRAAEAILRAPRSAVATPAPLSHEAVLQELGEGRLWSASSLERWIRCPVAWLVERPLRPAPLDGDPEPLARGALAHAALRDTLAGLRERTGSGRPRPEVLGLARELLQEALDRHEAQTPPASAPERLAGARRRLRADLERYLEQACTASGTELEPSHLELAFGFTEEDEHSLPACELGEGLRLRGRIDRVDISPAGQAVVYDYKSGRVPPPDRWLADGNLQVALYMRVCEQLLGVPSAGGFYQPLSGRDLRPRGLLAADAGIELDAVNGDVRDRADLDELLAELLRAAHQAAAEARAGALEARPDTCTFAGGCRYPSICRCER
jgi:ATP-dependent helicase/DNAse subunit B